MTLSSGLWGGLWRWLRTDQSARWSSRWSRWAEACRDQHGSLPRESSLTRLFFVLGFAADPVFECFSIVRRVKDALRAPASPAASRSLTRHPIEKDFAYIGAAAKEWRDAQVSCSLTA